MADVLGKQYVIRELAEKMIDNRNNYLKTLKGIEAEAKLKLNMSSSVLYEIATHLNAKGKIKKLNENYA